MYDTNVLLSQIDEITGGPWYDGQSSLSIQRMKEDKLVGYKVNKSASRKQKKRKGER